MKFFQFKKLLLNNFTVSPKCDPISKRIISFLMFFLKNLMIFFVENNQKNLKYLLLFLNKSFLQNLIII